MAAWIHAQFGEVTAGVSYRILWLTGIPNLWVCKGSKDAEIDKLGLLGVPVSVGECSPQYGCK